MDARTFLGMEPVGDNLHWRMHVAPQLTTPGNFLFGGCGLGAALVALEEASGRPTVWATGQYLSYAPTHSLVEWEITLAVVGSRVTQGRAVGMVGDQEILTVNAALGRQQLEAGGTWVEMPVVPPPLDCPERGMPSFFADSVLSRVEQRQARGRSLSQMDGSPGDPHSAFWARVPGHLEPSPATLAVIGDWLSGGASQPLGIPTMGRSLDNTLRVVRMVPTEWILCDIQMHALAHGFGHGLAHLWAEDGTLLATASQSISLRLWSPEAVAAFRAGTDPRSHPDPGAP